MATTTSLTLRQRWTRFVDEEVSRFVFGTSVYAGVVCAKELYHPSTAHAPTSRLQQALRKTGAMMPVIALSCAVGIAGMKVCIAGVSRLREDYTRSSVLMAFPVAGALLRAHRGPRAMAMGASGFGALGYGSDYLFGRWHRMHANSADDEEEEGRHIASHRSHHQEAVFHMEPLKANALLLDAPQK